MPTKKCRVCGGVFDISMFPKAKGYKYGVKTICKECEREYMVNYRKANFEELKRKKEIYNEANKEHLAMKKTEYRERTKEIRAIRDHNYYVKHKEERTTYNKQYFEQNKEKILIQVKEYAKNNKEKIAENGRKYRENNKEFLAEKMKRWCRENPDKLTHASQKRRSLKKSLPATLTEKQWMKIKEHFGHRCCYCNEESPLQREHFIPLSKGGEFTRNNILPACQRCNLSKKDRDFNVWYKKQSFYSKAREKKILDFLGYNGNVQQLKLG